MGTGATRTSTTAGLATIRPPIGAMTHARSYRMTLLFRRSSISMVLPAAPI
jgi:hypothetical protein